MTMLDIQERLIQPKRAEQTETAVAAPPCAMIIFGATGDLTKRLVVPALYNLVKAKQLSNGFRLVGVGRAAESVDEWRKSLTEMLQGSDGEFQEDHLDQAAWRWLTDRMSYLQGDLNDQEIYRQVREHLAGLDRTAGTAGNYRFHLAAPTSSFGV